MLRDVTCRFFLSKIPCFLNSSIDSSIDFTGRSATSIPSDGHVLIARKLFLQESK